MPIEFRCSACSRLLRTPDESAGKKAKCPQCGTIVDVPSSSAAPGTPVGDIARSPFADPQAEKAAPLAPPDAGPVNPYAPPVTDEPLSKALPEETPRAGLPWERGQKSFRTFWDTTKLVMGAPIDAFSMMHREGGLVTPMLYAIAGGLTGALFSAVYNSLLQVVIFGGFAAATGEMPDGGEMAAALALQIVLQFAIATFAGTAGVVIGLFIFGGLYHLFLMMLGGARFPFETTFRVVAYVTGATSLIQVIPLCGQYIYGLVSLVYAILGLSAAHQISGGKAAAAVLLPLLLCVVLGGLIIGAAVFAIVRGGAGGF